MLIIKQLGVATKNQTIKTELFTEIDNILEQFTRAIFWRKLHPIYSVCYCYATESFGEQIKNSHSTKKKKLVPTRHYWQQGGLNKMEIQLNLVTYFLFLCLMNSIYSPNDP